MIEEAGKLSSACSFIFMQIMIKIIFIRMVSHLDSLWNRGTRKLGNSQLIWKFVPPTRYSRANQIHFHKKDFARRLVLKQRHKLTQKWPIGLVVNSHILKFNDPFNHVIWDVILKWLYVATGLPQTVLLQTFDITSVSLESGPVLLHSTYDIGGETVSSSLGTAWVVLGFSVGGLHLLSEKGVLQQ